MSKQFDDLTKSLAEGMSRRESLRKIGTGLAGGVLAAFGLASARSASANPTLLCCHYTVDGGHKFTFNTCQADAIPCEPTVLAGEVLYTLKSQRTVKNCTHCTN